MGIGVGEGARKAIALLLSTDPPDLRRPSDRGILKKQQNSMLLCSPMMDSVGCVKPWVLCLNEGMGFPRCMGSCRVLMAATPERPTPLAQACTSQIGAKKPSNSLGFLIASHSLPLLTRSAKPTQRPDITHEGTLGLSPMSGWSSGDVRTMLVFAVLGTQALRIPCARSSLIPGIKVAGSVCLG